MRLFGPDIAARTRGRILSGDSSRAFTSVSIDSRTTKPGDLFFAIVGGTNDGHRFIASACAAGASGVVISDESAARGLSPGTLALLVADTTRALQDLASAHRREARLSVAAITGSVGKTTTKELARLLVSGARRTHATPGNLNNHYGLPLAILSAPDDTEALVLEMGISTPGEMDRLVEIAAPDFGLVTRISAAHVGNFTSLSELAEEKMKLPRGSKRALLNADDAEQVTRSSTVPGPVTFFGTSDRARSGLRIKAIQASGLLGCAVTVEESGKPHELRAPLPGEHNARNLVAAAALARAMGVDWDVIERQAPLARAAKHRGEVHDVAGAVLVDDCYNANPAAMAAAVALLGSVVARGRRILVAGDMLELGDHSASEHARLGEIAADSVDVLLGVGTETLRAVESARARGLEAHHVDDADAAGAWLEAELREGDVALVKGSRGMRLEVAVDRVLGLRGTADPLPLGGAPATNGRASS